LYKGGKSLFQLFNCRDDLRQGLLVDLFYCVLKPQDVHQDAFAGVEVLNAPLAFRVDTVLSITLETAGAMLATCEEVAPATEATLLIMEVTVAFLVIPALTSVITFSTSLMMVGRLVKRLATRLNQFISCPFLPLISFLVLPSPEYYTLGGQHPGVEFEILIRQRENGSLEGIEDCQHYDRVVGVEEA
jgi:hypothetical protein